MLACMCPNILNCHGHVLAKQAHKLSRGNGWTNMYLFHPEDKSKSIDGGHIVFFKGEKCPLSNCYFMDQHLLIIPYGAGDLRHNVTFRFGVRQAFSAMKAQDMKLPQIEQTILESESLGALNIAIKSLESHVRLTGVIGPWACSETIDIMHQIISSRYVSNTTFRDCCSSLKDKCPCKATANLFWGCGVDLEILHLLDPRLHPDLLQGRNVLGWIIKAVHTELQEGSAKDFSWISRVMLSNKFTDNMKDGLRDVCLHLDITSSGRYNPP